MAVAGAPVVQDRLRESVRLVGTFEAPDRVTVTSEISAEVLELPVVEGQRVQSGELLARLQDDKLQARLREAEARLRLSEATLARVLPLLETRSVSAQELDEAEAAVDQAKASVALLQAELGDTRILAPFDGVLGERRVSVGQVVQPGMEIMELVRTNPLEIRFDVPERHLSTLRPGLRVSLTTRVFEDQVFEGEVVYLAPRLREETRTLLVKARVANPEGLLKPGMFAEVELVLRETDSALFVPESAVRQQGRSTNVMVRNAQGRAEAREVTTGLRQGGRVQILSGLEAGETVVAEGLIKIFPGVLLDLSEASRPYGLEPEAAPTPEPGPEAADGE